MIIIEKIKYMIKKMSFFLFKRRVDDFHKKLKKEYNSDFSPTILSSNCTAGLIYHNLGLKFNSPTINLTIENQYFLKFVINLKWYLEQELILKEMVDNKSYPRFKYPVCQLGDIIIKFNHYDSYEYALLKWNERKKRVNTDELYIIVSEDTFTETQIEQLNKVNCKRIVIFTKENREFDNSFQLLSRQKKPYVGSFANATMNGFHIFEKEFDYALWLKGCKDFRIKRKNRV